MPMPSVLVAGGVNMDTTYFADSESLCAQSTGVRDPHSCCYLCFGDLRVYTHSHTLVGLVVV